MNFGIVAEFNPLHNGHQYLLNTARENGADTVTVVMSESFVQRGETASLSPYERTKTALVCGADLVLSLPVPYATAVAERFALGGVGVLNGLGFIDSLVFGSECGDKSKLMRCAEIVIGDDVKLLLDKYLAKGDSFPTARQKAVSELFNGEFDRLLMSPNDILAIEYIKAIKILGAQIDILPIKRHKVSHDSNNIRGGFCSASALRKRILSGENVSDFMPDKAFEILKNEVCAGKAPVSYNTLETTVLYKLRTMSIEDFKLLPDVSEGLEFRIYEAVRESNDLESLLEKIKTKRYTHSRLRRIILCALLGIKKEDVILPVPYIRVLGFNDRGAQLLKQAKQTATLPIITKSSEVNFLSETAQRVFSLECTARDIFSLAQPVASQCGQVQTDKIIKL